jgi:hypothetical protein
MTKNAHLDETLLLAALDGQIDAAAATHLADCRTCADRISELRSMLESVASVEVPEPSPLFWDHFPARVSRAIDAAPRQAGWLNASRWMWGSAAAAAVVLVLMLLPLRRDAAAPVPTGTVDIPAVAVASEIDTVESLEGDEAWEMVRAVAEATDYDEVQESGLAPRAGSLERAAMELTHDERTELARLIAQEIKRSGASTP